MKVVAEWVSSGYGAVFISVLIVSFALFQYFFRFKNRIRKILGDIKKANQILEKFITPADFYQGYEDFKEDIEVIPVFAGAWEAYSKHVKIPFRSESSEILSNKPAPEFFVLSNFGIGNAVGNRLNSLPGTLTGLGILGTFLGLTFGIYLAKDGLTAGDTAKVTESLGSLLDGASLAFLTSVVGLISSIVFSWRKYKVLAGTESELQKLTQKIDSLLVRKSPEFLLFEVLTESKSHTKQLKEFNHELAVNIGEAFEKKVAANLSPLLEKLIEGIDNLSQKQSEVGSAAIEEASKAMNEQLVTHMGSQMNELGTTFNKLFSILDKSSVILTEGQKDFQEQAEKMARTFEESIANTSSVLETNYKSSIESFSEHIKEAAMRATEEISSHINASSSFLKESIGSLEKTFHKLDRTLTSLSDFSENQIESNAAMEKVVEKLGDTGEIFARSGEPVEKAVSMLNETILSFSSIANELFSVNNKIDNNVKTLVEANNKIEFSWKDYQERFESVDSTLNKVFEEIIGGLNSYTERVQEFHNDLDSSISEITSKLSGAIGEFTEQLEALAEIMEQKQK